MAMPPEVRGAIWLVIYACLLGAFVVVMLPFVVEGGG